MAINFQSFFNQAELSLAAYSDFTDVPKTVSGVLPSSVVKSRLTLIPEGEMVSDFSATQADKFVERFDVLDQYTADPLTNGFSATVFREKATGQIYFVNRGSDDVLADYVVTDAVLALGGKPPAQLVSMVNYYLRVQAGAEGIAKQIEVDPLSGGRFRLAQSVAGVGPGIGDASVIVAGHSLGGYLSTIFGYLFGETTASVYTYNAPGSWGVETTLQNIAAVLGNANAGYAEDRQTNLIGDDYVSAVPGHRGTDIRIFEEGNAHSQKVLTDSLAFYNILGKLDPSLSLSTILNALKCATVVDGDRLERTLDVVRKTLLGVNGSNPTKATGAADSQATREAFYANLYGLMTSTSFEQVVGQIRLAPLSDKSPGTIERLAKEGTAYDRTAYRYALKELNPFALLGADYSIHNQDGELNLYDPSTGQGQLSVAWLHDRAVMLEKVLAANGQDAGTVDETGTSLRPETFDTSPQYFEDRAIRVRLQESNPLLPTADGPRTIFGAAEGDPLQGGAFNDHLYGMAGSDTLTGGAGVDLLEGGTGDDRLEGGSGFDLYIVGQGTDTVVDSDNNGTLLTPDGKSLSGVYAGANGSYSLTRDGRTISASLSGTTLTLSLPGGARVIVENYNRSTGSFGIGLADDPNRTIEGDLGTDYTATLAASQPTGANWVDVKVLAQDYDSDGKLVSTTYQYALADDLGNPVGTGKPDRADTLYDSTGNDRMQGKGGNDRLLATRGGSDILEGGVGQDYLDGGIGNDRLFAEIEIARSQFETWQNASATGLKGDTLVGGEGTDLIVGSAGNDQLYSGAGSDEVLGGAGDDLLIDLANTMDDDQLYGGAGQDFISGQEGNDWLDGGSGSDRVFGGAGEDRLFGELGRDINAPANNAKGDLLSGGANSDEIAGSVSNDFLAGGDGDDVLKGGSGNDDIWSDETVNGSLNTADWQVTRTITEGNGVTTYWRSANFYFESASGDDYIDAGTGSDWVFAGTGNDYVDAGNDADVVFGDAGSDDLFGGAGDDVMNGDDASVGLSLHGDDYVDGEAGNDTLWGGGGNDELFGGENNDRMFGESGNDYVDGEDGDDLLLGQEGNDTLYGSAGVDKLQGGIGDDLMDGGTGADYLWGEAGNDMMAGGDDADQLQGEDGDDQVDGGAGDDLVLGGLGADTLSGGIGNDQMAGDLGGSSTEGGDDVIAGGAGNDIIDAQSGNDQVDGGADDDLISGREGNDLLLGGSGDDQLQGGLDDDTLDGGDGSDVLFGEEGHDDITGGDGNDYLLGGLGNDTLDGGAGDDVYYYAQGEGNDHIVDSGGTDWLVFQDITWGQISLGVGSLKLTVPGGEIHLDDFDRDNPLAAGGIEYFQFADGTAMSKAQLINALGFTPTGTPNDDVLSGTAMSDTIQALAGNDVVDARGGNDSIDLGAENDYLTAGAGNDLAYGGDGNDVLYGEAGDDRLYGQAGNDLLSGGAGNDTLDGGDGDDTFVFARGDGADLVVDTLGANTIRLGGSLMAGDVVFTRQGNDLLVSIKNSTDRLTVQNWFGTEARFTSVVQSDGTPLNRSDVEALMPRNQAPVLALDQGTAVEDSVTTLSGNVLINDRDPEGRSLRVLNPGTYTGSVGTLSLYSDGRYSYVLNNGSAAVQTLALGQSLSETFSYTATDDDPAGAATAQSSLVITVRGSNDLPLLTADMVTMSEDSTLPVSGNILLNDRDIDQGTVLRVANAGTLAGAYGNLVLSGDGSYQYQLNGASASVQGLAAGQVATEVYAPMISDGVTQVTGQLSVSITGQNDAPIVVTPLADQTASPNTSWSWQVPTGSFREIDVGDALSYTARMADGTALPSWLGFDPVTQTLSGRVPKSATGTLNIQIAAKDRLGAEASDVFALTFGQTSGGGGSGGGGGGNGGGGQTGGQGGGSQANEGVGNGVDAPPPGHEVSFNDGLGTAPGNPGAQGGNGYRPKQRSELVLQEGSVTSGAIRTEAPGTIRGSSAEAPGQVRKAESLVSDDLPAEISARHSVHQEDPGTLEDIIGVTAPVAPQQPSGDLECDASLAQWLDQLDQSAGEAPLAHTAAQGMALAWGRVDANLLAHLAAAGFSDTGGSLRNTTQNGQPYLATTLDPLANFAPPGLLKQFDGLKEGMGKIAG